MYHAIVFLPLLGALIAGLSADVRSAPRPANHHVRRFLVIAAVLSWIAF
jgi:NADH-quinone oxidoreductase subunit L